MPVCRIFTLTPGQRSPLSRPCMPPSLSMHPTMQSPRQVISLDVSRRLFLRAFTMLAGSGALLAGVIHAQSAEDKAPLMAYVGTFSSPLRDVPSTQVDLPPGNGRGI